VTTTALPTPPFRAEHIGSLLRPRELKDAFRARAEKRLGEAGLRGIQDRLIREAVRLQEDVGLHSITDGEFRRTAWSAGFIWALDGLVPERACDAICAQTPRGPRLTASTILRSAAARQRHLGR
jgi:methionine synthase II (cobalamin-independent)